MCKEKKKKKTKSDYIKASAFNTTFKYSNTLTRAFIRTIVLWAVLRREVGKPNISLQYRNHIYYYCICLKTFFFLRGDLNPVSSDKL